MNTHSLIKQPSLEMNSIGHTISVMDSHIKNYALSLLHGSLGLVTLLVCVSIESYIFLMRWDLTYHLLPLSCIIFSSGVLHRLFSTDPDIYLINFSCLRPPAGHRVPTAGLLEHLSLINCFDRDSIAFMAKMITSSGLGEETYFPPPLRYLPPHTSHRDSLAEAEYLLFPALDDLLYKTGLAASDIDVLVLNCSGFCPAPSLTSLVVHRYSLRSDVCTFNLSGMGCSAGAAGLDVAGGLLRARRGLSNAVVLSTEIISTGWYSGRDRRKLILNCFFRTGCAAVLLTNKAAGAANRPPPKYKLAHLVRTQRAFDDRAYRSAIREEDAEGITGFSIERDLLRVAAETLRSNVVELGMSILPAHEKLRYLAACFKRASGGTSERAAARPAFGSAVQHYCMPGSGRGVIEEIGRGLGVGEKGTEAARMTFRRFGNQSSASMWYQLAYMEAKGRVRMGDKVWMLAMGSGPKCNSVVWECVRDVVGEAEQGPWAACIHRFPPADEDEGEEGRSVVQCQSEP